MFRLFAVAVVLAVAPWVEAATWQYVVPVAREKAKLGEPGKVFLWLPPKCETARGVLLLGKLGIEGELIGDEAIRAACSDCDLAIVYFDPHLSGLFHYWQEGNTDRERLLKALEDLATRSGHAELRRVPWITAGHSTAGIFCRNVAYWQPKRVAAVIHIKSGNLHQAEHLPPDGSLAGVSLVAINGQFETFGPEGGLRPELGRETQWVFIQRDLQTLRQRDGEHLLSLLVHPGEDHFFGGRELCDQVALFLRKTAEHRLPKSLPPGDAVMDALPLKAEGGWLTDPDLYAPKYPPAYYASYAGNKTAAMWHYDEATARAAVKFHRNLAKHQALETPTLTWIDDGDGWSFRAESKFLEQMPESFSGRVGGKQVGHANGAFVFRSLASEPVEQIGASTFLLRRPIKTINVAAFQPGDETYHATTRWGSLKIPEVKGEKQTIVFPEIANLRPGATTTLNATADLKTPVFYEVDYGPVAITDGTLRVIEIPTHARFPIDCRVTAYHLGSRVGKPYSPARPVSREFQILAP